MIKKVFCGKKQLIEGKDFIFGTPKIDDKFIAHQPLKIIKLKK